MAENKNLRMKTGLETRLSYIFYTISLLSFVTALYMFGCGLWMHDVYGGIASFFLFFLSSLVCGKIAIGLEKTGKEKDKVREQRRCTDIANTLPIVWGWGGPDPKPWGCIITESEKAEPDHYSEWYCDKCPVQDECPYEHKEWSK